LLETAAVPGSGTHASTNCALFRAGYPETFTKGVEQRRTSVDGETVFLAVYPERDLCFHKNPPLSKTAKAECTKALLRVCGIINVYR
jgi:hypothetical protein